MSVRGDTGPGVERWPTLARVFAGLVALTVIACLLLAATTYAPSYSSTGYMEDLGFLLDAVWRTAQHQVPSVDFISPIGAGFYGVYALVMKLQPFGWAVIVRANLLVSCVVAVATVAILRRTTTIEALALLALIAFLTALSGREFGTGVEQLSVAYLAPYNRWGWAIIIPVAAGLLLPRRDSGWLAAMLVGLLGAYLFFLKLSYFGAYVGLLGASLLLEIGTAGGRRRMMATAIGAAVPLAVAILYSLTFPGMMTGYLHDIAAVAALGNVGRFGKLVRLVPTAGTVLGLALLVLYLAGGLRDRRDWRNVARCVLLIGAAGMILLQNHEWIDPPLYFATVVIAYALGATRRDGAAAPVPQGSVLEGGVPHSGVPVAFALALVVVSPPLIGDIATTYFERALQGRSDKPRFAEFEGTMLSQLRFTYGDVFAKPVLTSGDAGAPECVPQACRVLAAMTDGVAALRKLGHLGGPMGGPTSGPVMALSFSNPYPALVGLPSPKHVPLWWDAERTYNTRTAPPADQVLSDVALVMQAKLDHNATPLTALYAPAVARQFHVVLDTTYWRIWQRGAALPVLSSSN